MDVAEVADLGDPAVLLGFDLVERREHRGERDVDPDVDRAHLGLDSGRDGEHLVCVGDIGRHRDRGSAGPLDLGDRTGEPLLTARHEHDGVTAVAERHGARPADPAARTGHHDCRGQFGQLLRVA